MKDATVKSLRLPRRYDGEFLIAVLLRFAKVALCISVVALACQQYFELLVFDKTAVAQGEYWRLLSGHFTHSSFSHGLWDVIAFSVSLMWLAYYSHKALIASLAVGVLMVDILLLSNASPLSYYCGLSGLLFSPLIAAAYLHAKHHKNIMGAMPILLIVAKLIADLTTQQTLLVNTHWHTYPESHLAGATAGLLVAGVFERLLASKKI